MSTILAFLKSSTWECHQRLEQRLPLLRPGFSRLQYRRFLQGFLGFYRPLEPLLRQAPEIEGHLPDLARRTKTPWLETDLATLGMAFTEIQNSPNCEALPHVADLASALGCLYVLEGSTLGGQVISRHLQRTLALNPESGARFFASYGADTPAMWQAFGECLTATLQGQSAAELAAVEAARSTFLQLEAWLETCGLLGKVKYEP